MSPEETPDELTLWMKGADNKQRILSSLQPRGAGGEGPPPQAQKEQGAEAGLAWGF